MLLLEGGDLARLTGRHELLMVPLQAEPALAENDIYSHGRLWPAVTGIRATGNHAEIEVFVADVLPNDPARSSLRR
jgi:hypothetical protein